MPVLISLVTLLAVAVYLYTSLDVARARTRFGVAAPATTGNPDFERVFRVQMNTLEWMPVFLPSLWIAALFANETFAALLGLMWIIGRVLYIRGYGEAAEKRATGFNIQAFAGIALWVLALIGVLWHALA
jgi:glutathione S-transferase